jgi:hypothetical protein
MKDWKLNEFRQHFRSKTISIVQNWDQEFVTHVEKMMEVLFG